MATAEIVNASHSERSVSNRDAGARDPWYANKRIGGLARFAITVTLLNILGHAWLGFEQAWITPIVALISAYGTELAVESIRATTMRQRPRFLGSFSDFTVFLLSAHITGLVTSMLLYSNERFWVIAFAASAAVASKHVFRVIIISDNGQR